MNIDPDQPDPRLPEKLLKALGDLHPPVPVPAHLDERILHHARLALSRQRRGRVLLRWGGGAAAAAAAILAVAIWVIPEQRLHHAKMASGTHRTVQDTSADLNGDGQVNVLDALFLASAVDRHQPLDASWDFNSDGVVDRRDADALRHSLVLIRRVGPQ